MVSKNSVGENHFQIYCEKINQSSDVVCGAAGLYVCKRLPLEAGRWADSQDFVRIATPKEGTKSKVKRRLIKNKQQYFFSGGGGAQWSY